MMDPPGRDMSGTACLHIKNTDLRFTSMSLSH